MNRTVSHAANAVAIERRPVPRANLVQDGGVSGAPLREAFKMLASEGLLDLHPKPGRGGKFGAVMESLGAATSPARGAEASN